MANILGHSKVAVELTYGVEGRDVSFDLLNQADGDIHFKILFDGQAESEVSHQHLIEGSHEVRGTLFEVSGLNEKGNLTSKVRLKVKFQLPEGTESLKLFCFPHPWPHLKKVPIFELFEDGRAVEGMGLGGC